MRKDSLNTNTQLDISILTKETENSNGDMPNRSLNEESNKAYEERIEKLEKLNKRIKVHYEDRIKKLKLDKNDKKMKINKLKDQIDELLNERNVIVTYIKKKAYEPIKREQIDTDDSDSFKEEDDCTINQKIISFDTALKGFYFEKEYQKIINQQ